MRKLFVLMLAVLLLGTVGLAKTNFFENLYIDGTVTVVGTVTLGDLNIVGDLDVNGATIVLDGSTSVRSISAGFISLESPANRLGRDASFYMQVATAVTTGITTVTHTGSAPTYTHTANSFDYVGSMALDDTLISTTLGIGTDLSMVGSTGTHDWFLTDSVIDALTIQRGSTDFVVFDTSTVSIDVTGDLDVNGAIVLLDGSTSVRGVSAGFVSLEADDIRFGFDASDYMQLVTTTGTGAVAITHVGGTSPDITWAADTFAFTTESVTIDGTTPPDIILENTTAGSDADSGKFYWRGEDDGSSTDLDMSIFLDVESDTDYKLSFLADGATPEVASIDQSGDLQIDGDISVDGGDIFNATVGAGLDLEATPAGSNAATTFVEIIGTTAAHTSGSVTDLFLAITPTLGIAAGTATHVQNLLDMTFSTPVWVTVGATSTVRAIYINPVIGAATNGTNVVNLIEIDAIAGDDTVPLTAITIGALTPTGAVENAIVIGDNWDTGISSGSAIFATSTIQGTTVTSSASNGAFIFSGATDGTLSTSTAGASIIIDAADAAVNAAQTYVEIVGTTPAHDDAATHTDIFLDITPGLGIAAGTGTHNQHLVDLTFTTPAWVTAAQTSVVCGIYIAPTLGAATNGTNTLALIDIPAFSGDDEVSTYGIRMGAMTGGAGTDNAIDIGAGWDVGLTTASPVVISTAAGSLDFSGGTSGTISTSTSTAGLVLDAEDAADGADKTYVQITASPTAHTGSTPTSTLLDFAPTLVDATVDTTINLANMTFTLPDYGTAVTSVVRGLYFAPTIGNTGATGTNTLALIDVAAIATGDQHQDVYVLRVGAMTQEGAETANAIDIGATWDAGLTTASPIVISTPAGSLDFSGATSGTISTSAVASTIVLDALDQAADAAKTYVEITGTTPAHNAGATTTDIFLDITPTIGIAQGTAVANTHLVDMTFTTPVWITAGATGTVRGMYIAPTIGDATFGTNTVALIDVAAISGDAQVSLYGIRFGALTATAATENAIEIGATWDAGVNSASPIVLTTAAGDIDIQGEGITNTIAGGGIDITCTQAAANTATTFVDIIGTTAAHASLTGDDVFLAISPTIGNATGTTVNTHLVDLTFSTPTWGAGTNVVRGVYVAPTVTNATAGTNTLAVFDIATIAGDDLVNVYGLRIAALTGAAALTENAIDIGSGWDAGIDSVSPIVLTSATGDIDVQGEDITNTIAGGGLDFDATAAAAGTATTFYDFMAAIPAHGGATPDDIIINLSPTLGLPTVSNTVAFINSIFTLPSYATGAVTNVVALWHVDPTIGDPTNGTNELLVINVAAIGDLDEEQDFYGIRFGAMVQEGGTQAAEALTVGTGFDYGVNSDSPVKGLNFIIDDTDADVIVDSDDQTAVLPTILIPNFTDATADFLVTNVFTVILPFAGGQAGEDTDGAGTNGGGMLGSTVDITTHDFNNSGAGDDDVLCKVYDNGNTTWDDLSTTIGFADWGANYQLQADGGAEETGDAFAIGMDKQFCEVVFNDLGTVDAGQLATYGANAGKWQYSTATDAWTDLTVWDNTDLTAQDGARPLQRIGAITFVPPANWGLATYDLEEAYWIQWTCTAVQITQPAQTDSTNKDEPIVGIPTTDSFQAPYNMSLAEVRVTNMGAIHNANMEFIVGNFTDGEFSAVLTWTANQWNDWFDLAAEIPCDAGDIIGIMITDDNGAGANPFWMVEFQVTYED